jgi:hypothetical protein
MKKITCIVTTFFIIVSICIGGTVFAAVIDSTEPYSGDYILVYNSTPDIDSAKSAQFSQIDYQASESIQSEPASANSDGSYEMPFDSSYKFDNTKKIDSKNISPDKGTPSGLMQSVGDTRNFYSYDLSLNSSYSVSASYMFSGKYCDVYVEQSYVAAIGSDKAAQIGSEFDNNIRDKMVTSFGKYLGNTDVKGHYDINGKMIILLEDIRDEYYHNGSGGKVYGYFWDADLASASAGGTDNCLSMIHIDIPQQMKSNVNPDVTLAYTTLVHEFQHLISETDYQLSHNQTSRNSLWLNEAFSMAAEQMILGTPLTLRITEYNQSPAVRNGAILTYENYSDNNNDVGANYGLSYLFGQYLRTQTKDFASGGDNIFKTILHSDFGDYRSVTDGLAHVSSDYSSTDFATLNRNFRIATILKESYGAYGFRGESAFDSIKTPLFSGINPSLKGSAAVIKHISSPETPFIQDDGIEFCAFSANETAGKLNPPVANTASGYVDSGTSVELLVANDGGFSEGSTIKYTTDGSLPGRTSGNIYDGAIHINQNTTIKAMAYIDGKVDSDIVSFTYITTHPRPSVPTGLSLVSRTSDTVTISWNNSINASGYSIYCNDVLLGNPPEYILAHDSEFTIDGLFPSTQYSFAVVAVNSEGVSGASNPLIVKTLPASFTDITPDFWGYSYITYLLQKNLFDGYALDTGLYEFRPANNITRQEFIKVLVVSYNLPSYVLSASCDFTDVSISDWFYNYVAIAETEGLTSGMGDGKFGTGLSLTREEMTTFVARSLNKYKFYNYLDIGPTDSALEKFSDGSTISSYARASVAMCTNLGVINGYNEGGYYTFRPKNNITRAEIAAALSTSFTLLRF